MQTTWDYVQRANFHARPTLFRKTPDPFLDGLSGHFGMHSGSGVEQILGLLPDSLRSYFAMAMSWHRLFKTALGGFSGDFAMHVGLKFPIPATESCVRTERRQLGNG